MKAIPFARLRKEYRGTPLREEQVARNPFLQFDLWFQQAVKAKLGEPNAFALATATKHGVPSCRMLLLKGLDNRGFVFFTNYESRKGVEIAMNPRAALLFYWPELFRQVRVEGSLKKISRTESSQYFQQRPRVAQIGAILSKQSRTLAAREELEMRVKDLASKKDVQLTCPSHWGGYRLIPTSFEFWHGRENRLHDRIQYKKSGRAWKISRLSP
jgi:pyridoxamine 5'-phosphate oxidase